MGEKETIEDSSYPCPVVFTGPSGVGKGTLIEMLMKQFPSNQFGFSVSHTTRSPREGETDGVHYNFTSVNKMKNEIDEGQFIEYAEVRGNYYGTSVEAVESVKKQGKICILDIDVQGVSNVKTSSLESKYIFIAPPSMDVLEKRLRGRGTEKEEDITKRLSNAAKEMEYGEENGNFDGVFVNDNLVEDFSKIKKEFKEWYPHLVECTKKKPEEVTSSEIDNDADKSVSETASAAERASASTSTSTSTSASASASTSSLALARGNTDEKKEKEIIEESSYPCPVVFSGPSGVGKGTLIEM